VRRLELILGISFALVACRERTREPDPESLIEDVRIAGCEQIRRGPICEIENDTKVVLWVQAAPESKLTVEGTEVEWTEVDGGWRTTFEVTTATKSIDVVATRRGRDKYALPVVVWKRPPWLVKADALRTKSATTALAILDANEEGADVRTLADVATMRARIAFSGASFEEAIRQRRLSATFGEYAELISGPVYAFGTIAWIGSVVTRDVDTARRAILEAKRRLPHTLGGEPAYIDLYEAVLAREVGDARGAIELARRSESFGRRLEDVAAHQAAQIRADVLGTLGLHEQANALYRHMATEMPLSQASCAVARFLGNRAWVAVLADEFGRDPSFDARTDGERALAIYQVGCPNLINARNVEVTLALDALHSGDDDRARSYVERAQQDGAPSVTEVDAWSLIVLARLATRAGKFGEALAGYEGLEALGERVGADTLRWSASIGRASTFEASEDRRRALESYEAAEAILEASKDVPFAIPGHRFNIDAMNSAARRHASLALELRGGERAVEVLHRHALRSQRVVERSFRIASLRGVDRREWERAAMTYNALRAQLDGFDSDAWSDADTTRGSRARARARLQEEIRSSLTAALRVLGPGRSGRVDRHAPAPGEVVLTIDRLGDGWIVLAETEESRRWVRRSAIDVFAAPTVLTTLLLQPFTRQLDGRTRVRIVARDLAQHIDFHALPWNGRPFVASYEIIYASGGFAVPTTNKANGRALVVADPTGNLPHARDEARAVGDELRAGGVETRILEGRSVTRRRLESSIRGVSLLHWAGHGTDDAEVGFSAALPLAGRALLGVADILALPSVPARVVLSGCTTAPPHTNEVGPARAFVLAGSHAVIATTREVKDGDARLVTSNLYKDPDLALSKSLRAAQLSALATDSASDWAAFRVYVP
jgi:hypothetical protein